LQSYYSIGIFSSFWEGDWTWLDEVYFNTPNVDDSFKTALAVILAAKWTKNCFL